MIEMLSSFADFINMGGYGLYIWPAWGFALLVLLYNLIVPRLKYRKLRRMIARSPDPRSFQSSDDKPTSEQ